MSVGEAGFTLAPERASPHSGGQVIAPARRAIRALAFCVFVVLVLLAARAVQLAFSQAPEARASGARLGEVVARADILDRNGALLATTVRAEALAAEPARVWDAPATADALRTLFPELDRATLLRRLSDRERARVYLKRGLTPGQREAVMALGLAGLSFVAEDRRVYPKNELAAHVLGFTDPDMKALAGVELGLDETIRRAGAAGVGVRLSLDVRVQHAVETELAAGARAAGAQGAGAILLDGKSGETLALASWPSFDPNDAGAASPEARRERIAGAVHELGSAVKPFVVAMALDARRVRADELFDVSAPLDVGGARIVEHEPLDGPLSLADIIARSSNVGAARLALRLGADRMNAGFARLGLHDRAGLELGADAAPLAPAPRGRRDIAALGFGYGLAASPAALAGAYTVFVNEGARAAPTLLRRDAAAAPARTQVFTAATARAVLGYMRATTSRGTGRAAAVPGLDIAGKTGTAEKLSADGAYDSQRNFSTFSGVFPAADPRFVLVVAIDEPAPGAHATGGAVAAPLAAAILRRAAPLLGLQAADGHDAAPQ